MKKNIIIFFTLFLINLNVFTNKVLADESDKLDIDLSDVKVDDTFTVSNGSTYKIVSANNTDISINSKDKDIYSFEIETEYDSKTTWRKFVKLDDICYSNSVCEVLDSDKYIDLKRVGATNEKIYSHDGKKTINVSYRTVYDFEKKEFKSYLEYGDENIKFNYNSNDDSKFDKDGVLTTDVEVLNDKNGDTYVSLRFITEALGAEVIWSPPEDDGEKDSVQINFFDEESYCKNITTVFEESCNDISEEELDKIEKCSDRECYSDRCKKYISENFDDLDNDSLKIKYKYLDETNGERNYEIDWKKKNIYFSKDKDNTGYGVVLYRGVPIVIDIINGVQNSKCDNTTVSKDEKQKCLDDGNEWVTDEELIELRGKDEPFCVIDLDEQITTSASR